MSHTATHLPESMPETFAELNAVLALRPINDKIDLENAYEVMDRLAVINNPTQDQRDYLDTLIILTETFDKEDNEAALAAARNVSGLELLQYLMEKTETSQAGLAKILGITVSAASMVVRGERSITADHARALGNHFKLNAGAFIR
jgi:antitoxin component HigA of HigAB toxin-antitoxin module